MSGERGDLKALVERIEGARLGVAESYQPCLDPNVVVVDRRALDKLLAATTSLRARILKGSDDE